MDSTKPSSLDISKLVFLGILLAALAAVWIFSTGRTTLIMAPVPPACGELTVSMPSGPHWKNPSKDEWTGQQNALVQQRLRGAGPDCTVEVQYQLSPITMDPEQYLSQAASQWRMEEVGRGHEQITGAMLTWAAMAQGDAQPTVYCGVAPLGAQRALVVRVAAKPGASLLASQIFDAVVKSLKYTDTGLAQKGAEIARSIRAEGLSSVATHFPSQVFSVKDQQGKETGFQVIRTTQSQSQNEAIIETISYDSESKTKFSRTRFVTTDMANFILHSWATLGNTSPQSTVRVEEGVLMAAVRRTRFEFGLSDAAVSGQIAELAGWNLLQNNIPEAVIDMVEDSGAVSPVRITPGKAPADPNIKESSAVFTSMTNAGVSQEVFFDPNGAVVRRIERLDETRTYERSDAAHIKELFPDVAEDIDRFMSGSMGTVTRQREIEYGKPI